MANNQDRPLAPRMPRHVMVVEDEKNQRHMLMRTLTEMEFEVMAFGSGEEALRKLDTCLPAVAVLDLNLPGISGLELAEKILQQSPGTRMIILTGYGDLDAARKAMRLDVVDFLIKPCPLGELEAAVSRAYQKAAEAAGELTQATPSPEVVPTPLGTEVKTIEDAERKLIADALVKHQGNRAAVARELGISVRTLYYRLSRYEAEERVRTKRKNG